MGYVIPHIYILTGDERYKEDFKKDRKRSVIGLVITSIVCYLLLISGGIYAIIAVGG